MHEVKSKDKAGANLLGTSCHSAVLLERDKEQLKWFAQCAGKCIQSARNRSDIMDSPIQDLILKGRTQNLVHIPHF